jgi:hypothetical protein
MNILFVIKKNESKIFIENIFKIRSKFPSLYRKILSDFFFDITKFHKMDYQSYEKSEEFLKNAFITDPKILIDALTTDKKINSSLFSELNLILPRTLIDNIHCGNHIGVRGNGLCGIYATLAEIIQNNKEFSCMSHDLFMEQMKPIMEENLIDSRPVSIDGDILCRIMRRYIEIYISDIKHPSFAIFSISDNTVKFDATKNSRCYMKNLITILHNSGHFESLIYSEEQKQIIYMELQEFSENKSIF